MKSYPKAAAGTVRKLLVQGALVLLPLGITLVVIKFALGLTDSMVGKLADAIRKQVPDSHVAEVLSHVPGLGLVFLLFVFVLVGAFARTPLGKRGVEGLDWLCQRIPVAKSIYTAVRRTVDLFSGPNKAHMFERTVWLDMYPGGARVLGFVVRETVDSGSGEKYLVVAIPGKPNPTGVTVVAVPEKNTTQADISPDEALRWGMTVGMLTPPETRITG